MSDDGTDEDSQPDGECPPDSSNPHEPTIDYSAASGPAGASQRNYDDAPTDHDGTAETATTFRPAEGSDDTNWRRLAAINDGKYADDQGKRSTARKAVDLQRDLDIVTEELEFTTPERRRCRRLLSAVEDVRRYQRDEVLVCAIVTVVANEDDRRIRHEDAYDELRSALEVTPHEVRLARGKLREHVLEAAVSGYR